MKTTNKYASTGLLNLPASYNYQQQNNTKYKAHSIDSQKFQTWTNNFMYQTSYGNSHSKTIINKSKSSAIPGYTGYIPSEKPSNAHGKTYTQITKQCFGKQNYQVINPYGLSTTGFNVKPEHFIDHSKQASTYKYGKGALQRPHSSWKAQKMSSTSHQCFANPKDLQNPTFRQTNKWLTTMNPKTKDSGYGRNNQALILHDKREREHGERMKTEYRQNFNKQKPFHPNTTALRQRKMQKLQRKKINYKLQ